MPARGADLRVHQSQNCCESSRCLALKFWRQRRATHARARLPAPPADMSGWDADRISYSNQNLVAAAPEVAPAIDLDTARARFREFIRTFRVNNVFPYRCAAVPCRRRPDAYTQALTCVRVCDVDSEQLVSRWNKHEHYIEVDLTHLQSFDEDLQDMLQLHPADLLPMVRVHGCAATLPAALRCA